MPQVQFASQAYQTRSVQLLSQRCINAFVEPTPKEGKTQMPVYGIPGLRLFSRQGNGPILGMHIMGNIEEANTDLYILSGPQLWRVDGDDIDTVGVNGLPLTPTFIGTTTLGGLTSMADNTIQLIMVDGSVGWIYQPGGLNQVSTETALAGATTIVANVTGTIGNGDTLNIPLDNGAIWSTTANGAVSPGDGVTITLAAALPDQVTAGAIIIDPSVVLAQIVSAGFTPAATVTYMDGYFVFDAADTRNFFLSGLNDGTQYSALDYAAASAGSDFVVGVCTYHEQLLIFCQQHTEVWWNAGNLSFPFQRYDAALIARGLASPHGFSSEDNTVFWMGDDGIFYRLNGFNPERISTFAMEHAWAQYPQRFLDVASFVLDQEGHKFLVANFISGEQTWCYDIAASGVLKQPMWHQRESWGTPWV